jgi:hypothetical protein
MDTNYATKVTVTQPGSGESASIPGFGAVYKIYSRDNGGEVAMVEHPFAVGLVTAPQWCSDPAATSPNREGRCTPCGTQGRFPAGSSRSSPRGASKTTSASSASC